MGNRKRFIILAALVIPLLVGTTLYRAASTLHDLEHAQERKAQSVAETLVGSVSALVRYGRDKKQRLQNLLNEVASGKGFVGVTVALHPAEGNFVVSTLSTPPQPSAMFGARRYSSSGGIITIHLPFNLSGRFMGRGCGHGHSGQKVDCSGWGAVVPGKYILGLTLTSENLRRVRSHVIWETIFLLTLMFGAGALGVVLVRLMEKKERIERQYALEHQRNETLENLQFISSGLAHETKNPLGSIRGYAQMIHERSTDERTREETAIMLRELDRVVSKVNEFMRFAGKKEPRLEDVVLASLVKEVVDLFATDFASRNIELTCEGCETPAMARVDPAQIKELCINLVINALQSCSEGDSVVIEVATIDSRNALV
ncbi:hypothetical protein KKF84_17180, partial [Myxococcota bacterium]|nr:hypothetical protein [Myxococcota bacterium]